jgi:hypothetical protein
MEELASVSLRRSTRRYLSQRDKFHPLNVATAFLEPL